MSLRFTEDEARSMGLVKDKHGNWSKRETDFQRFHSGKVPESKSNVRRNKKIYSAEETLQESGETNNQFRVVITARSHRHRDTDNLCAKFWIDMLKGEGGIFPDDSSKHIIETVLRVQIVGPEETEGTVIEVYQLDRSRYLSEIENNISKMVT